MKEEQLFTDKDLRDKLSERYDVLEKVKNLLLLPGTELMSVQQVADFYEVSAIYLKTIYGNNKVEIDSDGTQLIPRNFYDGSNINPTSVTKSQFSVTYGFEDGQTVTVNNRGLKAFSKRAVLRIGMLLQQSNVAKRIRTALLDVEYRADTEIKVTDINEEQKLALELGMAIASGNSTAIAIAVGNSMAFKNRNITVLQNDNKGLAGEILEWKDRSKLNAGVRMLSSVTGVQFGNIWNELYKNLQYKYNICLKQRGGKPFVQWVKEPEWENVIKTFCAMCEAYKQSPSEMFQQTTPKI